MVQALATQRADEGLRNSILPRRSRGDRPIAETSKPDIKDAQDSGETVLLQLTCERRRPGKGCLVAAVLISFATPAFAANYLVLADLESGKCEIATEQPHASAASPGANLETMGTYQDKAAAEKAMSTMKECKN